MIETEQSVAILRPIEKVWRHVRDIEGWASLMPGLQSCEVLDEDRSRWTLKVGAGGLVRTVKVMVEVDEWSGPGLVRFRYRLDGDPVEGGGTYRARALAGGETEVVLHVQVIGSGPMAPMWEALGKPLLPQFARSFAAQLKARIEAGDTAAVEVISQPEPARHGGLTGWLRALWQRLTGRSKPMIEGEAK
ncbi:SRPBCC family protein [Novosphingobium sp. BL-8A]|uniref:CoxG family protein n=1 Tax=Novosphingobium sp. BL-8A TaxID=3127639 RepID=UPI0037567619